MGTLYFLVTGVPTFILGLVYLILTFSPPKIWGRENVSAERRALAFIVGMILFIVSHGFYRLFL